MSDVGGQIMIDTQVIYAPNISVVAQTTSEIQTPRGGDISVGAHRITEAQGSHGSDISLVTQKTAETDTTQGDDRGFPPTTAPKSTPPTAGAPPSVGGQTKAEIHSAHAPDLRPKDLPISKVSTASEGTIDVQSRSAEQATVAATEMVPENWLALRIWAEMFHDAQAQRIAMTNRAERGGIDPRVFASLLAHCAETEHVAELELVRTFRKVPESIRTFQAETLGVGDHTLARLLGHLGHPVHAQPYAWANKQIVALAPFDRTIGQLWQYCGHGAPAIRTRGMTQEEAMWNGSPICKMLVHLIAEAIVKASIRKVDDAPEKFSVESRYAKSPLGQVYLYARRGVREHTSECRRCGPSGKPAQPGSPWNDGHSQAHALRMVGKEFLRGLWLASGAKEDTGTIQGPPPVVV